MVAEASVATTIPADTFHPHLCSFVVSETNNMIWKHIYHLAYRIQSLPFPLSYALEVTKKAVQKHQTKFRKQLRVMKILFLRTFFSTLFYFFFFEGQGCFFYGFGKVS